MKMRASLFRVDSWFVRIIQALGRDKTLTADAKEEIRYAVRKINQYFAAGMCYRSKVFLAVRAPVMPFLEKPHVELITKYANVIVDLLLSMHHGSDEFELLSQILLVVREILDCDKSTYQRAAINQCIEY